MLKTEPATRRRGRHLVTMSTPEQRMRMAKQIVDFEARRDKKGHLQVYKLPAWDGGGRYEVAGTDNIVDVPIPQLKKTAIGPKVPSSIRFPSAGCCPTARAVEGVGEGQPSRPYSFFWRRLRAELRARQHDHAAFRGGRAKVELMGRGAAFASPCRLGTKPLQGLLKGPITPTLLQE